MRAEDSLLPRPSIVGQSLHLGDAHKDLTCCIRKGRAAGGEVDLSGDVRRADSSGDHNAIQDAGAVEDAYLEESLDGRRGQFAPCSFTLIHTVPLWECYPRPARRGTVAEGG